MLETMDNDLGIWVKGLPYRTKINGKRIYRTHVPNDIISEQLTECTKGVIASGEKQKTQYRMEGRDYHEISELQRKIPRSLEIVPLVTGILTTFGDINKFCSLSMLMCSLFNVEDWVYFVKTCSGDLCTEYGAKISRSLIKIASTRIFADPEQSILELPVNSIDAYSTSGTVGKFGMGFFSILYWLVDHPKRKLTINSYYIENRRAYAFDCVVQFLDGELKFALSHGTSNVLKTGVRMHVDCSKDNFTEDNLNAFSRQMEKLRYITNVLIAVSTSDTGKFFVFNTAKSQWISRKVFVRYTKNGLLTEDYATGITLDTTVRKLFSPAISSKTIKLSARADREYHNISGIIDNVSNELAILVRKVGVVFLPFETMTNAKYRVIIDLPGNVRLPVSRDDIIIDESTVVYLENSLKKIFDQCISIGNVYVLQKALDRYVTYTSSTTNRNIVQTIMNNLMKNLKKYVTVSVKYASIFAQFNLGYPQILVEYGDIQKLESRLDKLPQILRNVYIGKKVLLVDMNEDITEAETTSYVFVRKEISRKTDWAENLALTFMSDKLFVQNDVISAEQYNDKVPEFSSDMPEQYAKVLRGYITAIYALETRYDLPDYDEMYNIFLKVYLIEDVQEIAIEYMLRMKSMASRLLPVTYYGSGKCLSRVDIHANSAFGDCFTFTRPVYDYSTITANPSSKLRKKIIDFGREFVKYETNLDTKHRGSFMPPLAYNPVYILSPISSLYTPQKFLDLCVIAAGHANDCYELVLFFEFFSYVYVTTNEPYLFRDNVLELSQEKREMFVKQFFSVARTRLNGSVKSVFGNVAKTVNLRHCVYTYVTESIYEQLLCAMTYYMKELQHINVLSKSTIPHIDPMYKFVESDLIYSVMKISFTTLSELFSKVQDYSDQGDRIQITEIAINEGSSKDYIDALFTETIQNSLDAVRSGNPDNANIEISLTKKGKNIVYTITDYVGVPPDGILSMMIPFLSSKTASQINTGEMGSGFFNIYRESTDVYVDSVYEELHTMIHDIPVRDSIGRVVDIERAVSIRSTTSQNYTTIKAVIDTPKKSKFLDTIARSNYLANTVFALVSNANIVWNGKNVSISKDLLMEEHNIELYMSADPSIDSYIFTKGVPFAPLENYISNMEQNAQMIHEGLAKGMIINIRHDAYTPVQTRTRINMPPNQQKKFNQFILKSLYKAILAKISRGTLNIDPNTAIQNFTSTASLGQMLFNRAEWQGKDNLSHFMVHYGNPSIQQLIAESYKIMGDNKTFDQVKPEIERKLKSLTNDEDLCATVCAWLDGKNTDNETPYRTTTKKSEENMEHRKIVSDSLAKLVGLFWSIGTDLGINGISGKSPKLSIKEMQGSTLGAYSPRSHSISLNSEVLYKYYSKFIETLETQKIQLIQETRIYSDLLSMSHPASTLVHELEHARLRNDHTSHNDVIESFGGEEPRLYTFDERANKVYANIVRNGLFQKWLDTDV